MTTAGIVDVVERARAHVCHGVHMGDIGDCKFCHLSCYIFAFAFTFGAAECYVLPSSSLAPCALALGLKRKKAGTQVTTQTREEGEEDRVHTCTSKRKKEENRQPKGGMGRTARRHHTGILRRGVWCASRLPPYGVFLFQSLFTVSPSHVSKERKKENRQPKGGMGGRHAATTQGF